MNRDLRIPHQPPAPSRTDPRDLAFFSLHPDRRYRARAPFREELRRAALLGQLTPLVSGQVVMTVVSRPGAGLITTVLVKARLNAPGVYPDSDENIIKSFVRGPKGRSPCSPSGVGS